MCKADNTLNKDLKNLIEDRVWNQVASKAETDDEGKGVIEIKCPNLKTYLTYATSISDNETLKKVVPEYYWQCQAHMSCTSAEWCDFIVFCPFASRPMHIVRIERDEDAINQMLERVTLAHIEANKIVEKFKKEKL